MASQSMGVFNNPVNFGSHLLLQHTNLDLFGGFFCMFLEQK